MNRHTFAIALLGCLLWTGTAHAAPPVSRYFQQTESDGGNVLAMQLAIREFKRDGDDRTISLAAMVHIGDRPFYEALQRKLDAMDVVLFEGVRAPGGGRAEFDLAPASDEARIDKSKRRVRFLAVAAEMHRRKVGSQPRGVDDLLASASERVRDFIKANTTDAWNNALILSFKEAEAPDAAPVVEITSLGADGKPGGGGAAADIRFSDLPPLKSSEIPKNVEGRGLQQQMASALGLVFQLDVMDHTLPNWRSSDLSVDQVEERMDKAGANADDLFKMLDGSSFQAGLAKLVLGLIKIFPSAQFYGKITLMQAMSRADDLLAIVPGEFGKAMDVIIKDRNAVVVSDLKAVLEKEPALKRIGIIYGGGHMADLEATLAEMGFKDSGVQWHDAIKLDIKAAGFSVKEAKQVRDMIDKSLDTQIKAAKRKSKKAKPAD